MIKDGGNDDNDGDDDDGYILKILNGTTSNFTRTVLFIRIQWCKQLTEYWLV